MWYSGTIMSAVSLAKAEERVLVVFVRSAAEDVDSDELEAHFASPEVKDLIVSNHMVALNLAGGTEAAEQFKAIYPVPRLPMTYLIGPTGKPLGILTGPAEDAAQLAAKIREALGKLEERRRAAEGTAGLGSEARLERARVLLEEKRAREAAEAEAKEREKELQRRSEGAARQEAQEHRRLEQARKDAEERRRQKAQDKAHLAKLREQIAADRREKGQAFGEKSAADEALSAQKAQQVDEQTRQRREAEEKERANSARLQFRFPDHTSATQTFPADDAFQKALDFVEAHTADWDQFSDGPLRLVQMYPRKELGRELGSESFRQLGLNPSAVLLVLPAVGRGRQAAEAPGLWARLAGLPGLVLAYSLALLNALLAAVGLGGRDRAVQGGEAAGGAPEGGRRPMGRVGGLGTAPDQPRRRKPDDDSATYNGNSTQQL